MMDRGEFLKMLALTPFAFKQILKTYGKEHIQKYSTNLEEVSALEHSSFMLRINKEDVGICKKVRLESDQVDVTTIADLPYRRYKQGTKLLVFEQLYATRDLMEFFYDHEPLLVEYYDSHSGKLFSLTGQFTSLAIEADHGSPITWAGSIEIV